MLIALPEPRLDAIFTGGGPVFPDMLERLAAARPATAVTAVYGSTEAEPIAHISTAGIGPDESRFAEAVGRVNPALLEKAA